MFGQLPYEVNQEVKQGTNLLLLLLLEKAQVGLYVSPIYVGTPPVWMLSSYRLQLQLNYRQCWVYLGIIQTPISTTSIWLSLSGHAYG